MSTYTNDGCVRFLSPHLITANTPYTQVMSVYVCIYPHIQVMSTYTQVMSTYTQVISTCTQVMSVYVCM
jgi:hypothetical protein